MSKGIEISNAIFLCEAGFSGVGINLRPLLKQSNFLVSKVCIGHNFNEFLISSPKFVFVLISV